MLSITKKISTLNSWGILIKKNILGLPPKIFFIGINYNSGNKCVVFAKIRADFEDKRVGERATPTFLLIRDN
jgi:hypothetical protein